MPFLQFRVDRALASADLATIEGRARAAEGAAAIVAEHPSDLVRDQYVMQLAGTLGIDADRLRAAVARAGGTRGLGTPAKPSRTAPAAPRSEPRPSRAVDRRELDALRWAIHEPELVADWLDVHLFADPIPRAAFAALASSATFQEALGATDDTNVRDLLERLAVEDAVADDEPVTVRARLMANVIGPAGEATTGGSGPGSIARA